MKRFALIAGLSMALFSQPASADMRATYASDASGFTMVLELNDDGALRGTVVGDKQWLLRVDDVNYIIVEEEDGPRVLDTRIMAEIFSESLPTSFSELMKDAPEPTLEEAGPVEIYGRIGTGYRFGKSQEIDFVMSDDPDLATLGEAMAEQFRASVDLMSMGAAAVRPLAELLETGAPLRFARADLKSIEDAPIDDERFTLPAAPLSKEESSKVMRANGMLRIDPKTAEKFDEIAEQAKD